MWWIEMVLKCVQEKIVRRRVNWFGHKARKASVNKMRASDKCLSVYCMPHHCDIQTYSSSVAENMVVHQIWYINEIYEHRRYQHKI